MTALDFEDRENTKDAPWTTPAPAPTEQGSNPRKRRLLLRRFWNGAIGFWFEGGDRLSWVLPAAIFATVLLSLAASYGFNIWNRAIFDALERRDARTVVLWSLIYFPLLAATVCLVIAQVYARMTMQRRWRAWLNNQLLDRWLTNGRYYQLNLIGGDHANPEYRIADDVRVATESPVEFAAGNNNRRVVGGHVHRRVVDDRGRALIRSRR